MPKQKAKQKRPANKSEVIEVVSSFESWLERQPVKSVRARGGFISKDESEKSD